MNPLTLEFMQEFIYMAMMIRGFALRRALLSAIVATMVAASAASGMAAELVMLSQQGCAWCLRFAREIAPAYPNTAQGKAAPLRVVDINAAWPSDLPDLRTDHFTPTFVLVEDGREIGRMRGYAGDEFFWFLLDEMLARHPRLAVAPAG
jgi:hypothetical protein